MSRKQPGIGQDVVKKKVSKFFRQIVFTIRVSVLIGLLSGGGYLAYSLPKPVWNSFFSYSINYPLYAGFKSPKTVKKLTIAEARIIAQKEHYYSALCIAIGASILAVIGLSIWFRREGKASTQDHHIRGSRLVSSGELQSDICKDYGDHLGSFLSIGQDKIRVPEQLIYRGFALCGRPGKRKSTLINYMMEEHRIKGGKGFVIDINGSYYSKFGRPGDKILSLRDKRTEYWSFWAENVLPSLHATYLVEANEREHKFFWKSARKVIEALLRHNSNLDGLWHDLTSSDEELLNKLQSLNELAVRSLGNKGSNQAAGVLGTAVLDFSFLRELGYWGEKLGRDKEPFSIVDWATNDDPNDDSWVFIIVRDDELGELSSLVGTWFNLGIHGCLRRDEDLAAKGTYPPIMFCLDELKSLGKLPELEKGGERLRKYRGFLLLGYQNNAQIDLIYGDKSGANLRDVLQNKVIYAIGEPAAQKELSEVLGEQEIEEISSGDYFDAGSDSRYSQSRRVTRRRNVLPSEIGALKDGDVYLKIESYNPCKTYIPWKKWPTINIPMDYGNIPHNYRKQTANGSNMSETTNSSNELSPMSGPDLSTDVDDQIAIDDSGLMGVIASQDQRAEMEVK